MDDRKREKKRERERKQESKVLLFSFILQCFGWRNFTHDVIVKNMYSK